jgi:hypothetical protein
MLLKLDQRLPFQTNQVETPSKYVVKRTWYISLYCIQHRKVYSSPWPGGICTSRGYMKPRQGLRGMHYTRQALVEKA